MEGGGQRNAIPEELTVMVKMWWLAVGAGFCSLA